MRADKGNDLLHATQVLIHSFAAALGGHTNAPATKRDQEDTAMPVAKGLQPAEARRCAAEAESMVWALIVIMVGLIGFGTFVFVARLGS